MQDSSEQKINAGADSNEMEQTTFSPENEMLDEMAIDDEAVQNERAAASNEDNQVLTFELFSRKTCPNCPPVKEWIASSGLTGRSVDVDTDAGLAEAAQKGVFAAPTVIFYKADGSETARAHSVAELEEIFAVANA